MSKRENNPVQSITEQKRYLRTQFTNLRNSIFHPKVPQSHFLILESQPWFQKSNNIAIYISQPFEFPTFEFFELCKRHSKNIFAPVIKFASMSFHRIESLEKLESNQFNIAEPAFGEKIDPTRIDVFFVPVVGFDWNGNRLGRGKGYYDILFSDPLVSGHRVGVGYEYQSTLHVPHSEQDAKLDFIFTEKQLRRIV